MTAKELRIAAEVVLAYDGLPHADYVQVEGLQFHEDAVEIARYILATVRDDDDEPVTYQWLISIKKPYMENRKIWWNFDGYTVSTSSSCARFHCNHMPIASVKTRGQFRAMCKGLGIVLDSPPPG